ncbi:hypothetical protein V8G54_037691 [Vigna mungo]|uniref:Uncharacterized protein n=1 Tax=Vigna mungo TaxID=3915 RepID=A0AAQ3MJD0_VIGMU
MWWSTSLFYEGTTIVGFAYMGFFMRSSYSCSPFAPVWCALGLTLDSLFWTGLTSYLLLLDLLVSSSWSCVVSSWTRVCMMSVCYFTEQQNLMLAHSRAIQSCIFFV